MRRVLPFAFSVLVCQLPAQEAPAAVQSPPQVVEPLAATLGLADHIPWRSDGQEYYERDPAPKKVKVDRMALIDAACAEAKQQGKLVLWYVHRIEEKTLRGRQMYRAPVLDIYKRQVLFASAEHLEAVGVEPGRIRENFTVEGADVHSWPVGQRLRVGDAVFEVTMVCDPCERMEAIRPGLRAELEGRRGMLARVLEGGQVALGDAVEPL